MAKINRMADNEKLFLLLAAFQDWTSHKTCSEYTTSVQ